MFMPPVSKIKVAFYCFFPGGGIGQYTHELLKRLRRLESLSVCLYCPPNFEWLDKAAYKTHPVLFKISSDQPLIRKMKFLIGQWINPRRFLNQVKKSDTHLVHYSNFNHLTYPAWKGLTTDNGHLVQACTAHDVKRAVPIINRNWETRQLRQFYKDCQLIFVHGENQKKELESFVGKGNYRSIVVPHGPYNFSGSQYSQETQIEPNDNKTSKGLFFGNIRDEKNLEGLLKALSLNPENLQLTVAGKSGISGHKSINYYKDFANSLGIKKNIVWLDGHTPN
jgi:glycosyltransferase involved in cell wall biosynthesis